MRIVTLVENTSLTDLAAVHGLSFYVETKHHKLLFDFGPDATFWENAERLGIDLTAVDIAFLSHAHNDHAGGLATFLQRNTRAKVYLQDAALQNFCILLPDFTLEGGLDPEVLQHRDRLVFLTDAKRLDEELSVIARVKTHELESGLNACLYVREGETVRPDPFDHEQSLFIEADGKRVLIGGCAHRGIINILNRTEELTGLTPDVVLAGFHLYNPITQKCEPTETVTAIGERLKSLPTKRFITGHCTGKESVNTLKTILGDRIEELYSGRVDCL